MNLSDFSLLKEAYDHYVVGHPKGRSIKVPKKGLSEKAHQVIKKLKTTQNFDEGGEAQMPDLEQNKSSMPAAFNPEQLSTPQGQPSEPAPEEQMPTNTSAGAELGGMGSSSDGTPPPLQQAKSTLAGMAPDSREGLNAAKSAIESGVAAQGRAGKEEQKNLSALSDQLAPGQAAMHAMQSHDENLAQIKQRGEQLQDALLNNKIDPGRMWNSMDTGSKIGTALSLIVGGIGAGMAHTQNMAAQFFNKAIDDDIDAQKNEQTKTANLYQMNRQALGDENQAYLATKNQLLMASKAKMDSIAAGTMGPQAAQNAAQAKLAIDQQIAQNDWMRSRLMPGKPATEAQHIQELQVMQQLRPDFYKDMQSKYIPGVGTSRVPVTEADRKALTGYDSIGNAIQDAQNFQKTQAGALGTFPGSPLNDQANNIRSSIVLELNNLHGLNRLNDNEYHAYLQSVPSPGSFFAQKSLAKLGELQKQVEIHKNTEMNHLGIMPFQKTANDQVAMTWARQNPNDPRSAEIMKRNGVGQ